MEESVRRRSNRPYCLYTDYLWERLLIAIIYVNPPFECQIAIGNRSHRMGRGFAADGRSYSRSLDVAVFL
jgi:hypothetical protein